MNIRTFAAFVIIGILTPNALLAVADGPDFYAVRNVKQNDVLNMRDKPNAKAKVVGTIPFDARGIENAGETFPEVKSDMDSPVWCKIRYKDAAGWVACRYLMEDSGE